MNVLIIGSGGREHALAWKASQSPQVNTVYVAPGNAGTAREPGIENVAIDATDINQLIDFAEKNAIGMTIVGPEAPLAAGIVDAFNTKNLPCFGPTQQAAQLESSKSFCKAFMRRHNIPTAQYDTFTDIEKAKAYVDAHGAPIVVKADGLAAGKGVIVAQSVEEAHAAIDDMLGQNAFGDAGAQVVIEEYLRGEEASFIVMADGINALALATSQDHKARDDGDKGPNTGGMGAYSPAHNITPELHQKVMDTVIIPTLKGMAAEGMPYTGFLYAGLMISDDGTLNVLEFNCRFGDPETQPIMLRLQSDLVALCQSALNQTLNETEAKWDPRPALGVVLAAGGYPKSYRKGDVIEGLDQSFSNDVKVFHAGTALNNNDIVTAGGRVLCVTALGENVNAAQTKSYDTIKSIRWPDMYFRTDIGHRAMAKTADAKG